MKIRNALIAIILILLYNSCNILLSRLYGIKHIHSFNQKKCDKFIVSIDFKNIPHDEYAIDSLDFKLYYESSINNKHKKDLYQPVQILYFRNDSLISFHANCYAKGSLTNLNWNTNDRFNYFIPKSAIATDSLGIDLNKIKNYFKINTSNSKTTAVAIFIIWTRMLEKISKSAIQTVIKNIVDNHAEDRVVIYLINNDKSFIEK